MFETYKLNRYFRFLNPGYTCSEVVLGTNPADPRVEYRPRAMSAMEAFETHMILELNCSIN